MVGWFQCTSFVRLCTPSGTVTAKRATIYVKSTKQQSTSPSTTESYCYLFNATCPVSESSICITMLSPIIRDVSPSPKSRFSPPKKVEEPKRRFEARDNETEDEEESQEYISETKNHTQLQRRQPSPTSPERRVQKAPATKKKANFKKPEPPQEPPKKPHKEHRSFLLAVHVLIALFVVDTVFPRLKSQKKDAEILAKKHKLKQERNVARSHKQLDEKKELRRLREERAKFQQQFQEQHYLRNEKARNARQYVGSPPEHRQHHPDLQGRGRHGRGRYWDEDRDVVGHQRRRHQSPRSPL